MPLYEAVKEAMWLDFLALRININIKRPILIYDDNNGCISIANNPTNHKRSKHIRIKYHLSRKQIELNLIKLEYCPTGNQLADVFTKPLPVACFPAFRGGMSLK